MSLGSDADIRSIVSGLLSEADPDPPERVRVDDLHGVSSALDDASSLSSAFILETKDTI